MEVGPGHVVLVPLGRGAETGYVLERVGDPGDVPVSKIRPISRLLDPIPAFDARQLAFFRWIAGYYLAPLGMVIQTALPSAVRAKVIRGVAATEAGVDALATRTAEGTAAQVLREIVARSGLTKRGMTRRLSEELDKSVVEHALKQLERSGWITWSERETRELRGRVRTVTMLAREPLSLVPRAGLRMRAVIEQLAAAFGPLDVAVVLAEHGSSGRDALRRLEQAGVVAFGERERRDPLDAPPLGAAEPPVLNSHQRTALTALTADNVTGTWLLFGVTGSGKTEVFLGAARHVVDAGKQVLVMVPEIGLTPQLVGRFRARFGDAVAVLHSGLSGGERLAQWRRIRAGEATIAVGARSALFAPFRSLGLIVVDEEHDDSYKQDEGVAYSSRDLAVVLGSRSDCPVILASATPSLESWKNALDSRYGLLRLPVRATPRPVPQVELVDLTEVEVPTGVERPLLAPQVESALHETFASGGQAIVLYNRRGFATMVQCTSCGGTYECPSCGITMTLHQRARSVRCHYCAFRRDYDGICPACKASSLEELGKGTERIEATMAGLFPGVAIARMDADTTSARGAHARLLDAFRRGETQLLVGTQIVAKGHDFPGVQTAVVVSADRGFRMPDFRAAERTCALLVQLAGRAGRGDRPGRVFVQTWQQEHYALQHLDDVERFFQHELRLREVLRYPPFTRLVLIRLDGVDRRKVVSAATELARGLRQAAERFRGVTILGPAPAALPRLVGRWRHQVIVRGVETRPYLAFIRSERRAIAGMGKGGVRVHVDVDPRHLM